MVSIPRYGQQRSDPAGTPGARLTPGRPAGSSGEQAFSAIAQALDNEIKRTDDTALNGALAAYNQEALKYAHGEGGIFGKYGNDFMAASAGTEAWSLDTITRLGEGLSPRARERYETLVQSDHRQLLQSVLSRAQGVRSAMNEENYGQQRDAKYRWVAASASDNLRLIPADTTATGPESDAAQRARDIRPMARDNGDGSTSTHIFTQGDNKAWPTLFQNPDGTWEEMSPDEAKAEAKKRGEVFEFDTEEEAIRFAEGSWKSEETQIDYAPIHDAMEAGLRTIISTAELTGKTPAWVAMEYASWQKEVADAYITAATSSRLGPNGEVIAPDSVIAAKVLDRLGPHLADNAALARATKAVGGLVETSDAEERAEALLGGYEWNFFHGASEEDRTTGDSYISPAENLSNVLRDIDEAVPPGTPLNMKMRDYAIKKYGQMEKLAQEQEQYALREAQGLVAAGASADDVKAHDSGSLWYKMGPQARAALGDGERVKRDGPDAAKAAESLIKLGRMRDSADAKTLRYFAYLDIESNFPDLVEYLPEDYTKIRKDQEDKKKGIRDRTGGVISVSEALDIIMVELHGDNWEDAGDHYQQAMEDYMALNAMVSQKVDERGEPLSGKTVLDMIWPSAVERVETEGLVYDDEARLLGIHDVPQADIIAIANAFRRRYNGVLPTQEQVRNIWDAYSKGTFDSIAAGAESYDKTLEPDQVRERRAAITNAQYDELLTPYLVAATARLPVYADEEERRAMAEDALEADVFAKMERRERLTERLWDEGDDTIASELAMAKAEAKAFSSQTPGFNLSAGGLGMQRAADAEARVERLNELVRVREKWAQTASEEDIWATVPFDDVPRYLLIRSQHLLRQRDNAAVPIEQRP